MADNFFTQTSLPEYPMYGRDRSRRALVSFDLELTARCNNDCRHCYINLPAGDVDARQNELTLAEIDSIAGQAADLGALWCLITGGEPLLRKDFTEIYMTLKRKGLLVSVFTNACLVTEEHVRLFQRYPPRDIEVSVYGVTAATYEAVTRKAGSYAAFRRGLDLLLDAGLKVRLKAIAMRSNIHELPEIARFCRERTKDYFRFDPLLHLRFDGDPARNAEIEAERLAPEQVAAVEQSDSERADALQLNCQHLILEQAADAGSEALFFCGAGESSFTVGWDGAFRLCSSLAAPGTTADLRQVRLMEAWERFVLSVRQMRSPSEEFRQGCASCTLINLCLYCPANAFLEVGQMDGHSAYFCQVAHARAAALRARMDRP